MKAPTLRTPWQQWNARRQVSGRRPSRGRIGEVALVGAGPGDPDLITIRGLRCLRRADVVLFDRLVHADLLAEAPACAELVDVGKQTGEVTMSQESIQALLISRAQLGLFVVRLKGGDPFLFGRGGEEALACAAAGVACRVIPGVSSALAAPAAAGVPVTHRGLAASLAVVPGHRACAASTPWQAVARMDTIVVLMGVGQLEKIVGRLLTHGKAASTPAALIERGTLPEQRSVRSQLGLLPAVARSRGVRPPATLVVGPTANLGEALGLLPIEADLPDSWPASGVSPPVSEATLNSAASAVSL